MRSAILAWIVNKLVDPKVGGFRTRASAAATRIMGGTACLLVIAESLILFSEGKTMEALWNLNNEQMAVGLAALGITEMALGLRRAIETNTGATLAGAKDRPALAQEIVEGKAPPAAATAIPPAP